MTHTSSFEIKDSKTFFTEMILPQYEEFLKRNSSGRHALLTIILTYHFYEWVHEKKFTVCDFLRKYPNQNDLAGYFDAARLLTNGTKHFSNKPVTTTTQMGFSSAFHNGFVRSLNIQLPDGSNISADQLIKKMVEFWKERQGNGFI